MMTGAATTWLRVKTPAMGPLCSETTSARSSRPGFLMPQWMPAARNPCGAVIPRRREVVGDFLVIIAKEMSGSIWIRDRRLEPSSLSPQGGPA